MISLSSGIMAHIHVYRARAVKRSPPSWKQIRAISARLFAHKPREMGYPRAPHTATNTGSAPVSISRATLSCSIAKWAAYSVWVSSGVDVLWFDMASPGADKPPTGAAPDKSKAPSNNPVPPVPVPPRSGQFLTVYDPRKRNLRIKYHSVALKPVSYNLCPIDMELKTVMV